MQLLKRMSTQRSLYLFDKPIPEARGRWDSSSEDAGHPRRNYDLKVLVQSRTYLV